jgi:hypothetical protein
LTQIPSDDNIKKKQQNFVTKMDEKVESNNNYETVGDEDVLLFEEATFMVRRFKELAASKFTKIVEVYVERGGYSPRKMMDWMSELCINEETKIMGGDIKWNSPTEGIDCQLLIIGAKGWQKGKLKIEVNRSFQSGEAQTSIKFCPDEPLEPKSPLDDIRQSEEYKKLSNNN